MNQKYEAECDLSRAPIARLRAAQRVLVKTRELLEKPEAWNRRPHPLDADGNNVSMGDESVVSWPLEMAVIEAGAREGNDDDTHEVAYEALRQNLPDEFVFLHEWSVAHKRTHADVMLILQKGVQTLQSYIDARPA